MESGTRTIAHSSRASRNNHHVPRRKNKTMTVGDRETHQKLTRTPDPNGLGSNNPDYLDGKGTPTPSEKVSKWHRDIFLVSPTSGSGNGSQQVHPRQCLCDQCMAEYGTFKFYNDIINEKKNSSKDDGHKLTPSDLLDKGHKKKSKLNITGHFHKKITYQPNKNLPISGNIGKHNNNNFSSSNSSFTFTSRGTVLESLNEIQFGDEDESYDSSSYDGRNHLLGLGGTDDHKLPEQDELFVEVHGSKTARNPKTKTKMLLEKAKKNSRTQLNGESQGIADESGVRIIVVNPSPYPQASTSTSGEEGGSNYMCGKAEQALFSRTSSTSGTDSSLRIRKSRSANCTERRWFICVSMAMIFTVLVASAGIYFGYQFLRSHLPSSESVYRGKFKIVGGDFMPEGVAEVGSHVHAEKSKFYQHKLDLVLTGSPLAENYMYNEVFLLEGHGSDGLTVHFNIHMDPTKGQDTNAKILREIISEEIKLAQNASDSLLGDLVIEEESVEIEERSQGFHPKFLSDHDHHHETSSSSRSPTSRSSSFEEGEELPLTTEHEEHFQHPPHKRQCVPFQVDFCSQLPYNFTSFPNPLGHKNINEAARDIEKFKEIVDAKCYGLAYEFVCQLLQPVCFQQKVVLPCKDFCLEFLKNCGNILPAEIRDKIQCDNLATESDGPGSCISKPGCVAELRNAGKGDLVCDGVVDCPDFSDELYCPYCPEHHFHCGVGKMCIPKYKMCDGNLDCDNGADEKGCLSLAPHMDFASYVHQYYDTGYLVYQEGGEAGKVCADHMNKTVPPEEVGRVLNKLGQSMCNMLEYRDVDMIEIQTDKEPDFNPDIRYVDMIGPMSDDKRFIDVPCPSQEVVHISCSGLQCGRRPGKVDDALRTRDVENRGTALHGDWPWHVALYKNGVHVCDGTLISSQWIMTTSSCFQGQGRSQWIARFASVRLNSRAPWEQKRRIVGMIKSPVEGNSVVILKMDKSVVFSDFARPICLPSSDEFVHIGTTCVTLGWNTKGQQLRTVHLEPAERQKCEAESEVSPNTICTQEKSSDQPCNGEEMAGSPLICQGGGEWHLVGVSAWRKGCSSIAQRPRLFDKVSPNSEWARKTLEEMERQEQKQNSNSIHHNHRIPKKTQLQEKG